MRSGQRKCEALLLPWVFDARWTGQLFSPVSRVGLCDLVLWEKHGTYLNKHVTLCYGTQAWNPSI